MTLDELDEAWHLLSLTEKTVLKERFGLNGDKPRTFAQIGKSLGVSHTRIRQHESRALAKLRRAGTPKDDSTVPVPHPKPAPPLPIGKTRFTKFKPVKRKKRKPKPKPKWKPPSRTDTERLDWLENWIPGSAMAIRRDYEGGLSLYRGNDTQLSGANLRELLDLILFKNVSPENK